MKNTSEKPARSETWPQWIAGIGVLVLLSHMGCIGAWSSPYIHQLTSLGSPFLVTLTEMSWVVSLMTGGRPLGAVSGTMISHYWGSKTGVLISCVPVTLCWLFTVLANKVEWLYVARFSAGIGIGMIYGCYALYLAEIAESSNRGMLLAIGTSGIPCGNILITILGAYLPMKESAEILLIPCLLLILLFIWLPESPHYLVKNNEDEKARSSIGWYHRNCDVDSELMKLRKFIEDFGVKSIRDSLREMRTVHFRKSLIVVGILSMYTHACGFSSVMLYMETIFTLAKLSLIQPSKMVMIVMTFGLFGAILSTFLMDKWGRKILMIVSCLGITFAFILLTLEFHLLSYGFEPKTVEVLAIVGISLYNSAAYMGAIPVPSTMIGEVFPPHLKCTAACIISCCSGIASFIVASTFVPLLHLLTERYLFLFYAVIVFTAVPFTVFCVPETKGMSLQEIQSQLGRRNKSPDAPKPIVKENVAGEKIESVYSIHDTMKFHDTVNTK